MKRESEPYYDLGHIVDVLGEHGVEYVLIGGVSGTFHGMTEYRTKDVDLLVQDSARNGERLAAALAELGAVPSGTGDRRPITSADLTDGNSQWDTDAGSVDVLITAAGPNETILRLCRHRARLGPGRHR